MRAPSALKRLQQLRLLEEEREETRLRMERARREECLAAWRLLEEQTAEASRALHAALQQDDRTVAMLSEMEISCLPMRRIALQHRLKHLDIAVHAAAVYWQGARVRRLQIDSVLTAAQIEQQRVAAVRQQKALDSWFLAHRSRFTNVRSGPLDESFQREPGRTAGEAGTQLAEEESA